MRPRFSPGWQRRSRHRDRRVPDEVPLVRLRPPENTWQNWGLHVPPDSGFAAVAFKTATYDSLTKTFSDNYVAETTSGTVELIGQIPNGYQLWLDLAFRSADGTVLPMRGYAKLYGTGTSYPCIG